MTNHSSPLKKLLLGGFVFFAFVGYSVHQRGEARKLTIPTTNSSSEGGSSPSVSPNTKSTNSTASSLRDGQYTGSQADAFYGNIQVRATISGGKLTDVVFLQYPNDRSDSIAINQQAMPILKQEAIQAQDSEVDIVSGATDTSRAFKESLRSALSQARA